MKHLFFATSFEAKPFIDDTMKRISSNPDVFEGKYRVIIVGTGLVQSAVNCTKYFECTQLNEDDQLINLGIAGTTKDEPIGTILKIKEVSVFTNEEIPKTSQKIWNESYPLIKISSDGECLASSTHPVWGEGFSHKLKIQGLDLVDMEAYSFALACQNFKLPFKIFKSVSDKLTKDSQDEFLKNARLAIQNLFKSIDELK